MKKSKIHYNQKRKCFRCIALLLSVVCSLAVFQWSAIALTQESSEPTEGAPEALSEQPLDAEPTFEVLESEDPNSYTGGVTEIVSMREENVKHFKLTNGTYEAISYGTPVHRRDASGAWKDIDNSLSLQSKSGNAFYATADQRVVFAKQYSPQLPLLTLNENGYAISMKFRSSTVTAEKEEIPLQGNAALMAEASVTSATSRAETTRWETIEEAAKIENRSIVRYPGIKANTDIEYVLDGNQVKENIIVKTRGTSYVYAFEIGVVGLQAALTEQGEILFTDAITGAQKYSIPAPYMFDSVGEISYGVTYALSGDGSKGYVLTVRADAEWINDESRVFPITIDPTILTTSEGLWDTYISSSAVNTNYNSSETLWVSSTRTTLIKITMPSLPVGATLNYAMLHAFYYYYIDEGSLTATAYQVLQDFPYNSVTWTSASAYSNCGISTTPLGYAMMYASPSIREATPGEAQFEITEAVEDWLDSPYPNYGIAIKRTSGTNGSVILKSGEAGDGHTPYLRVAYTYTFPEGVYAIKNVSVPSRWMTIENGAFLSGYHLQQKNANVSPASSSTFDRSSLFKISHKEGNFYIIRSLLNNKLSFGLSGTQLITKEIPNTDDDVSLADTFIIEWDGQGFLISPYGRSVCISMSAPTTENLTVVNKTQTSQASRWGFEQYSGTNTRGVTMMRPSSWRSIGIIAETSGSATLKAWSTYINDTYVLRIKIDSNSEKLGTLTWDSINDRLSLVANFPGRLTLVSEMQIQEFVFIQPGNFHFQIVPQEGVYYIQNVETTRYIDVEGPYTTSGTAIQEWNYHGGRQERWMIEHVENSGGYIRLKSVLSSLYIGVDPSDSSTIRQYDIQDIQNDYTLWRIDRSQSGKLIILCKATEQTGKVLAVPSNSTTNGKNLLQLTYTNDTNVKDEWYLIKKVISIVNYFDETFVGNEEMINNIKSANLFANTVYSKYYGIGVYMDGGATQHLTKVDNCTVGINSPCSDATCGADCYSNHHKNTKAISDQIYNEPREDDHIYVLWTDRKQGTYCFEKNGIHTPRYSIALVHNQRPVIHFLKIQGSSTSKLVCMSLVLVHEMMHCFGMSDVYDNPGHDVVGDAVCVMEYYESTYTPDLYASILKDILEEESDEDDEIERKKPFCNSCHEAVKNYTSNIVIEGN